jgi:hypothetical protein
MATILSSAISTENDGRNMDHVNNKSISHDFFVLAREHGTVRHDLPAWASKTLNPFQLEYRTTTTSSSSSKMESEHHHHHQHQQQQQEEDDSCRATSQSSLEVERREIENVPGTFQLLNILSKDEATRMGTSPSKTTTIYFH